MTALIVAGFVLLVLALIAWGSAWKTMEWLGDAEDLIELVARTWGSHRDAYDESAARRLSLELGAWERRTPKREPV